VQVNKSRLAIVTIVLALVFVGIRMGHRSWWFSKIVRETEQEIVDAGFELVKLGSPISPQEIAPQKIKTLLKFVEEAETADVNMVNCFRYGEHASFYIGRKGMYKYSYELKIVPVSGDLFPKYVMEGGGKAEWTQSEAPLGKQDVARIEIYQAIIHDMYDRSSFTRGRKVPIFISPVYRITTNGDGPSGYLPSPQPSEDRPLLLGLIESLEDLPAKEVSFARREEVVDPMSTGGTVRGGGAFITIETTMVSDYTATVTASIYYGNLGAEGYRYVLGKIDDSWTITGVELTWIA